MSTPVSVKLGDDKVLRVVWSDAARKKLMEVVGYVLTSAIALGPPPPDCPVQKLGVALGKFRDALEPKAVQVETTPDDAKKK